MRKVRTKRIGGALIAVSLVSLGVSAWSMAQRLQGRPMPLVYFSSPIVDEKFNYLNEPVVVTHLSAAEADAEASRDWWAKGRAALRISYRGSTVDFPIIGKDHDRLPGLLDYESWFKIMPMVTGERTSNDIVAKLATGEIHSRIVIAGRYPAPGFNEGSTGLVRRTEWVYRLAELHSHGDEPITVLEKTFEELDALHTPGKWTAIRHPEWVKEGDERDHDIWMHYAMQQVTPAPFLRAKDRALDAALGAMGWTWPVAGMSVVGVLGGLLLVGLGIVRVPDA